MAEEYSTVLVDKEGIDLMREAKMKLLSTGFDNLEPHLREKVTKRLNRDKLEAFSRGTLVIIALLALIDIIEKDHRGSELHGTTKSETT